MRAFLVATEPTGSLTTSPCGPLATSCILIADRRFGEQRKLPRAERSFFRHPRLAQALEEPLVVSHPCRIVGQRQLLLSQLADRCGGDAGQR
jgi:hypothetical protein